MRTTASYRIAFAILSCVVLPASPSLAVLEDRTPTNGSNNVPRECSDPPGKVCNENSDCDSGGCPPMRIDLTVNFKARLCASGDRDGLPCLVDSECLPDGEGHTCDDIVGWTPDASQMQRIRDGFTEPDGLNDTIYDVTDGQVCLRNISFVVDHKAPNAIVQFKAGRCFSSGVPIDDNVMCLDSSDCPAGSVCISEGAFCGRGAWGAGGKIATGPSSYVKSMSSVAPERFAHEFMHLFGNLYDEYQGVFQGMCGDPESDSRCFGGSNNGGACTIDDDCPGIDEGAGEGCRRIVCIDDGPPSSPTSDPGCLMRCCLANIDDELCWDGNHDPNQDTSQHLCHAESCWRTFRDEWPSMIKMPAGAPVADTPAAPQGQGQPCEMSFFEPNVQQQVVTVVDRSASMANEDPARIVVAADVASNLVDQLKDGAEFGVASFASEQGDPDDPENPVPDPVPVGVAATQDFPDPGDPEDVVPLQSLDSNADRDDAKMALDDLENRTGGFTNIGAGLLKALDMFNETSDGPYLDTSVVLLTDGQNNQGNLNAALAALANEGIPVYLSCIGEAREDPQQCADIADKTQGAYVDAAAESDLNAAFVEITARTQREEIAFSRLDQSIQDGATSPTITTLIEDRVENARFVLTWKDVDSGLDLVLKDPDGQQVDLNDFVDMRQGKFYNAPHPEAGEWTMEVEGTDVPAGSDTFSVHVVLDNKELNVEAGLTRSNVNWGGQKGFQVYLYPSYIGPIAGCEASVAVTATKKDDLENPIDLGTFPMLDDGEGADSAADDGNYFAFIRGLTPGDGIYTFRVDVSCRVEDGAHHEFHFDPGSDDIGDAEDFAPPPSFDRVIRFSGGISNVPENIPPFARICEDVLVECEGMTTDVDLLDGTCSFDPEDDPIVYGWTGGDFVDSTVAMPAGSFPLGRNDVTLTVTDEEFSDFDQDEGVVIVADTIVPDLQIPDPIVLECNSPGGIPADDEDIQQWLASASAEDICDGTVDVTDDAPDFFPAGCEPGFETGVTFRAKDLTGNGAVDGSSVTVVDTLPPDVEVLLDPDVLWPPNHRMVDITATVLVDDLCDESPSIVLASISSDEPDNAQGNGDGNTTDDIQGADIGEADFEFQLRAERAGTGDGRTYTVTYAVTDECGNETIASAEVFVPHDQSGKTDEMMGMQLAQGETGTVASWGPVEGAEFYNVIRGDLVNVAETGAGIALGPVVCVEATSPDQTTVGNEDVDVPESGSAFFYLVEYGPEGNGTSSYGAESGGKPRLPGPGACK